MAVLEPITNVRSGQQASISLVLWIPVQPSEIVEVVNPTQYSRALGTKELLGFACTGGNAIDRHSIHRDDPLQEGWPRIRRAGTAAPAVGRPVMPDGGTPLVLWSTPRHCVLLLLCAMQEEPHEVETPRTVLERGFVTLVGETNNRNECRLSPWGNMRKPHEIITKPRARRPIPMIEVTYHIT